MSGINITPFVDIVLVLLIIFMVTSPMLNNGYNVNLPKVVPNKININKQQQIIFTVDKLGKIRVGDNAISINNIANYLQKYDPSIAQVFIKGDTSANYGVVINLMGEVHKNGFNNISLVTDTLKK
ncbi:ExbD/TolR family protein [Rickettsiales bacterium LUAb2]